MSLISTKNLVAPLTNMVHLITILLIAIAFAVLRLSGASMSIQSSSTPVNSSFQAPVQQQPADLGSQLQQHQRPPAPWQQGSGKAAQPAAPADQGKKGGGLDDIEKALGL